MFLLAALVGTDWNQVFSELKEWAVFGHDYKLAHIMP